MIFDNLKDVGLSIVGSTWLVGYSPTSEDSVKIKGGLWLNEVGMEDTKKETTMVELSAAKVNDKFNYVSNIGDSPDFGKERSNQVMKVVFVGKDDRVMQTDAGGLHVFNHNCKSSECGTWKITAKHEPRWWLKDLPDASFFEFYDTYEIRCESNGFWWANSEKINYPLNKDKMPKLTGDEHKLSKISIPDLRTWQKANG
jgi:hypothetical protein